MVSEIAIKKSFKKVKEDMNFLFEQVENSETSLQKAQENNQQWFLSMLRREDEMHKRMSRIEERLAKIENALEPDMPWQQH
ncbi:MAG: hypothetical protein ACOCZQ_00850 [Nanoarchaeota archaeon]